MGPTTLPPSCAECLAVWEPQHPGILRALFRPVQGLLFLLPLKGTYIQVSIFWFVMFSVVGYY